jgi:prepilin peptidase CpaA
MGYLRLIALILAGGAVISDLVRGTIPNIFCIGGAAAGFLVNVILFRGFGVKRSLVGCLVPLVVGFALFYFRMIGAGDVKEVAALGAICGYGILELVMVALLFGAGISIVILWTKGIFFERMHYAANWVMRLIQTGEREPYRRYENAPENFHFSIPILLAVLFYAGGVII